jgi:hypothetical protein
MAIRNGRTAVPAWSAEVPALMMWVPSRAATGSPEDLAAERVRRRSIDERPSKATVTVGAGAD